jgi:hypothetical protein
LAEADASPVFPEVVKTGNIASIAAQLKYVVSRAVPQPRRVAKSDPTESGEYTREFLTRCLLFVVLHDAAQEVDVDWFSVPLKALREAIPDSSDVLASFPEEYTAGDVSGICFGRGDLALFVPILACLWKQAADRWGEHVVGLAASQSFCEAAVDFVGQHGFAAHPEVLLAKFGDDPDAWPQRSYRTSFPTPTPQR